MKTFDEMTPDELRAYWQNNRDCQEAFDTADDFVSWWNGGLDEKIAAVEAKHIAFTVKGER